MKKGLVKFLGGLVYFIMLVVFIIIMFSFGGCTQNQKVKEFGGTAELYLPKGQKLVVMTWKEDNLWTLTKPMKDTDIAETYTFSEESSFGMFEGTYIIHEVK